MLSPKSTLQITAVLGCAGFALQLDCWLGQWLHPVPEVRFFLLFLTGTAHHDSLSVPSRSTTHNYFFAKFHTGKRRPDSGWVTSVVCQQVATLLIGHLPLIWIISYQGAAPAGQRMGNVSCSQGYLQRPGSCSKESLKRSTRKGKLEGMQGKNRGKEPISDLSITDVTNENLVHRVLGKKD